MSARQSLRSGFQISRPHTICWRCSLEQQRRQSSSARVSASNPLEPEAFPSLSRTPKRVSPSARHRVVHNTTRSHQGLPQNGLPATKSSHYGDLAGERRSSWSNRNTRLSARPAGIGPAIATPIVQHVLWTELPMLTAMSPPLPRNRRCPYTSSAVRKLHFANFMEIALIEAAKLCSRTEPVGAASGGSASYAC